jgi:S-adenosylmethionine/arginine decarboxylase-like enzyme
VETVTQETLAEMAVRQTAWGIATSIDIYDCDPATIRDAQKIKQFVRELCELIEMKRFGETLVVHFGEEERVAGYSMVQLIETSLISAHFANLSNTVYLDVFSCKAYDPDVVADFAQRFFGGSHVITHVNLRL